MSTKHTPGMSDCLHPQIITYVVADDGPDHGKPAGIWACEACRRKFAPMDLAAEDEADSVRSINKQLLEALQKLADEYGPQTGRMRVDSPRRTLWFAARAAIAKATGEGA